MKKHIFLLIAAVGIFMANQANTVPPFTCTCMGGPEYMNPGETAVFNVYPSQTITSIVVETQEGSLLYGYTTRTGNAITFRAPNYVGFVYLRVAVIDPNPGIEPGEHISKIMIGQGVDPDLGKNYQIIGPSTIKKGETGLYTFNTLKNLYFSNPITVESAHVTSEGFNPSYTGIVLRASSTYTGVANVRVNFYVNKYGTVIRTYKDFTITIVP